MRSIRTTLSAAVATALLASCGVAPQAGGVGGSAGGGAAPGSSKAARYHTLSVTPVCTCDGAYGSDIEQGATKLIGTFFGVLDSSGGDAGVVQYQIVGEAFYEGTTPDVVIAGDLVTITETVTLISGAGAATANVVIVANTNTGAYTTTVDGNPVVTGSLDIFGASPGSCEVPFIRGIF